MTEDVRLRDGSEPRANHPASVDARAKHGVAHAQATYAALDLGTNNCRLLIARPSHDGFRVIDSFSRIIRLGEGIATTRHISEAAIARATADMDRANDLAHNLDMTSFSNSVSIFDYATNCVLLPKSLSWTGEISHAAASFDYDFKGRQLTSTEIEFVASVTQPV